MFRETTVPVIQSAIIAELSHRNRTHKELFGRVKARVAFDGVNPKPGSVRARVAELTHSGLVEYKYKNADGVKVWGLR